MLNTADGVGWEFDYLVLGAGTNKTLVLLPPLGPDELTKRWTALYSVLTNAGLEATVPSQPMPDLIGMFLEVDRTWTLLRAHHGPRSTTRRQRSCQ